MPSPPTTRTKNAAQHTRMHARTHTASPSVCAAARVSCTGSSWGERDWKCLLALKCRIPLPLFFLLLCCCLSNGLTTLHFRLMGSLYYCDTLYTLQLRKPISALFINYSVISLQMLELGGRKNKQAWMANLLKDSTTDGRITASVSAPAEMFNTRKHSPNWILSVDMMCNRVWGGWAECFSLRGIFSRGWCML